MPIRVQCTFLGISVEDAEMIKNVVNGIIDAGAAGDAVAHKEGNDRIYAYIDKVIDARRKVPYDRERRDQCSASRARRRTNAHQR